MLNFKIVADSSADLFAFDGAPFAAAPLKIITAENEYTDVSTTDVKKMVFDLLKYKGKSSTSCPNPEDWIKAFGDAQNIFCVAITATLSGSYNAACIAKEIYEEQYPDRRVHVINTLTAGPEMKLIVEKISELESQGLEFDEVVDKINKYMKKTGLLFMLESLKNLSNNGRVSPLVAKMAGILGIRLVGKASDQGDLEPLDKCRGEQKAIETILNRMITLGYKNGKVRIAHCFNEGAAENLKSLILEKFESAKIEIYKCGALCSFYAEKGGLLVGFEKA